MANVVVKLRVMPETPDVNVDELEKAVTVEIVAFGAEVHKVEKNPIAFGLVALDFIFLSPEDKGAMDPLEEQIKKIEHVQSCEVIDVRRAFG